MSTTFNLIDYAADHGLRTRNVHDGGPVPRTGSPPRPSSGGYTTADERCDVIVCAHGYVDHGANGPDSIGAVVAGVTEKESARICTALEHVGAHLVVSGDTESIWRAELALLPAVLAIMAPYTCTPHPAPRPRKRGPETRLSTQRPKAVSGVRS